MNRPSEARHFCKAEGCTWVAEPGRNAHKRTVEHRFKVHGLRSGNGRCHYECGYMALPSQGRFTKERLS